MRAPHRESRPDGQHELAYPPEHHEYVRRSRGCVARALLLTGAPALLLCWGYFTIGHGALFEPLFALAPFFALAFLLVLLATPGVLFDARAVVLLPYFKKGGATVRGDTFLHGQALARQFMRVEAVAIERGLEPLSCFGFADDLAGQSVTWHEAKRGLRTVEGLLAALREQPGIVPESAEVEEDLARIEESLRGAAELDVPFCLLLRHGNSASGHEMDARQGYFTYGGEHFEEP